MRSNKTLRLTANMSQDVAAWFKRCTSGTTVLSTRNKTCFCQVWCQSMPKPSTSARHRSGKISFLRDHNVPNAGNMALGKSETLKQIILSWAAFGSQTFSSGCLPGPFIAISFTNFSLGTFCMGTAPLESSQGMCCLLLFHLVICFLRMRGTCCNGTSCSMTSWTQRVWNCVSEK